MGVYIPRGWGNFLEKWAGVLDERFLK